MTNGARNFLKRLVSIKRIVGKGFSVQTAFLCLPEMQYCKVYIRSSMAMSFMDLQKIHKISGSTYVIPQGDEIAIRIS